MSKFLILCMFLVFNFANAHAVNYEIKPLIEDVYIYSPLGKYSFWFQTNPGTIAGDSCYIDLVYTNSQMIIPASSFMTLLINNKAISSTNISAGAKDSTWRIFISAGMISEGYNEVVLSTLQRTNNEPCQDLYNRSNWVCIKSSTVFVSSFADDSTHSYISSFPYPFFDYMQQSSITSNITLSQSYTENDLKAFFSLASYLGSIKQSNSLYFNLAEQNDSANTIYLGGRENFSEPVTTNVSKGEGLIKLTKYNGASQLLISGGDEEGMKKSLYALANENLKKQADTNEILINKSYTDKAVYNGYNKITLTALGIKDINITGIFDQKGFITIKRPLNFSLGAETYIRLKFLHSANLNPRQSLLTVAVNGKPAASVTLNENNTKEGYIDVKIPSDQMDKSEWMFELACYHDIGNLGSVDCTHLYDEAAWTFIDAESSEMYFAEGPVSMQPSLTGFPYTTSSVTADSNFTLIWLPANAQVELIELAGTIAARSGTSAGKMINYKVVKGNQVTEDFKNASSVIAIGFTSDTERWNTLKEKLYIKPGSSGSFEVSNDIEVINTNLKGTSILQSVRSPWNVNGIVYTVMLSSPAAIEEFTNSIAEQEQYKEISGQVALIKGNGEIISLRASHINVPQNDYSSFLYSIPRIVYYILGGLIVLALIFLLMRVFRKKAK